MGDALPLELCLKAALNYLPAATLFIGLAALLVGLLPRLGAIIWAYLVFSFFVAYLGNMLAMPEWLEKLSPFSLLPRYPAETAQPELLLALLALSLLLAAAGAVAYRRRDLG
jgi:ABC-2 type transport system permease protein